MNKKHLFIGLIIAALACYFTFRNVSWDELQKALLSIHLIYLLPAAFFLFGNYYIRAVRWKYLILSIKDVHHNRLISPVMIGFTANLLPARVGELIRAYLLSKRESIPFSSSFATIVIERVFDMIMILALLGSLIFLQPDLMGENSALKDPVMVQRIMMFGWFGSALVISLIAFSLLLIFKKDLITIWLKFFCRPFPEHIQTKILNTVNSFAEGLHVLRNFKTTLIVIFLSIFLWVLNLLTYYPFFYAFDLDYLPFSALIIVFIVICIFITIFPTPGFIGSFQAGCMVGLNNLYGVPEATAASFGIVIWFFMTGLTVAGGIYFIIKDNISMKEVTEHHS